MKTKLIVLSLCLLSVFLQNNAFVTNATKWQLGAKDCIILGDAHIDGEVGKAHREKLLQIIDQRQTPTLFVLEDCLWFPNNSLKDDTLQDISFVARKHNGKKSNVDFIAADKRGPHLSHISILCDDLEDLFNKNNYVWHEQMIETLNQDYQRISQKLGLQTTIEQFKAEIDELFSELKEIEDKANSSAFNFYVSDVKKLYKDICTKLNNYPESTPMNVVLSDWLNKARGINLKNFVHCSFLAIENQIADLFFIAQLFKENRHETVVFFVGQAHADRLNEMLEELEKNKKATFVTHKGVGADIYSMEKLQEVSTHDLDSLFPQENSIQTSWLSQIVMWVQSCFSFITSLWT